MRDDDSSAVLKQLVDSALQALFCGGIQTRCSFIANDKAGITKEDARKSQQLRRPRGQGVGSSIQLGIQAFGQGTIPITQFQFFERGENMFISDRAVKEGKVVTNTGSE